MKAKAVKHVGFWALYVLLFPALAFARWMGVRKDSGLDSFAQLIIIMSACLGWLCFLMLVAVGLIVAFWRA